MVLMARAHDALLEEAQELHVVVVMIIVGVTIVVFVVLVVGGGSVTGTATQGGVLSVVHPPPRPRQGVSRGGVILPSPPHIVILVVLFGPTHISGLSCHGPRGSCSNSCCAAAAATVIPLMISIAEYVVPPLYPPCVSPPRHQGGKRPRPRPTLHPQSWQQGL